MRYSISNTAEYGDLTRATWWSTISRASMKDILKQIRRHVRQGMDRRKQERGAKLQPCVRKKSSTRLNCWSTVARHDVVAAGTEKGAETASPRKEETVHA